MPFIPFQSTATVGKKTDKAYDYDVLLCFFSGKINRIMEVIIAVLRLGDNFGTKTA